LSEQTNSDEFVGRRRLLQLEMLYEIGLAINDSLDPSYVAQQPMGQVGLQDLDREVPQLLQLTEVDQAWQQRKPVQIKRDCATWCHLYIVPLLSRQEITGLLIVADKETREGTGPFDEDDETLLRSFAYQAGAALHNARLHLHLQEAYDQLQIAQKKLAQMEQLRALGNLATDVAHAMSHTLGIIIGRADMYVNFPKDPERAMSSILETAESGQRIIDRIRQFTRLGVGKKRSPVLVHDLFAQAIDDVRALWQQRHGGEGPEIEWQIRLHPLPETYVNPTDIKEVADNLLINALEAMPTGGRLTVESRREEDQIVLEIGDSGIGMAEDVRQRVFEPFFTTKEEHGTGLGLSIVYQIVNDHDGEIEVQSTPGQGSHFALRLPIRSEAPPALGQEDEEEDGEAGFDS
jgi:signal transduction histidine kinase